MRILISGAGIAGLASGVNLANAGHDVTIIERADRLRVGGSPVDVRGDALVIADRMGIGTRLRDERVTMTERTQFVDSSGATVCELPTSEISDTDEDLEITRESLADMLREALPSPTPLYHSQSIDWLHDDGEGVDVILSSGRSERFDLVIGADGMHSNTRKLAFGPEQNYVRHLGLYVALTRMPLSAEVDRSGQFLNWPGHMIGTTQYDDVVLGVMNFRSPWIEYDYRDIDAQRAILLEAFSGHDEWRVPQILDSVRADDDLYFDSVSQIVMPSWHRSRVLLVGDAAHCASGLSGRGASLALLGGWAVAAAIDLHPQDLEAAACEYQRAQLPYAERAQATAGPGGDLIVPATQAAIDARNQRLGSVA